ncbi:hypothetical protein F3J38_00005 [Pantoea sp. Acro-805]|uniref:Uncharacterized protein n=1 Tax=Candidatus Pantoea formicae TaxID=2608355 RepID=A0ABX0QN06_9GAMM|nr:hypothetical protein [Pantoea formicae]NIE98456.1 hypothetical protein [Pantoea formicae]
MSDEQRIESFEARIQQLQKDLAEQRQKLLTHEIMSGLLLTNIVRIVNKMSPKENAAQILLDGLKEGQAKAAEGDARNDPHTKDAFINAINAVNRAMK